MRCIIDQRVFKEYFGLIKYIFCERVVKQGSSWLTIDFNGLVI